MFHWQHHYCVTLWLLLGPFIFLLAYLLVYLFEIFTAMHLSCLTCLQIKHWLLCELDLQSGQQIQSCMSCLLFLKGKKPILHGKDRLNQHTVNY